MYEFICDICLVLFSNLSIKLLIRAAVTIASLSHCYTTDKKHANETTREQRNKRAHNLSDYILILNVNKKYSCFYYADKYFYI